MAQPVLRARACKPGFWGPAGRLWRGGPLTPGVHRPPALGPQVKTGVWPARQLGQEMHLAF